MFSLALVPCGTVTNVHHLRYHVSRMVEYIENEAARKKAEKEAQRAKLEALERQLGIDPSSSGDVGPSSSTVGKKHRFDDTEYLEQSRDIVDGVKNAVAAGAVTCTLLWLTNKD